MNIDLKTEIKQAIKEALTEWVQENEKKPVNVVKPQEVKEENKLLTVKQFIEKYPFISHGGMRHRLNFRQWNKFHGCVSQIGKRIYIKEKEALEWFKNPPPEADWKYDENKYKTR